MADVAGVVDALRQRVEDIEVFGVGLPTPLDAGQHRLPGDVLRTLQVAEYEIRLALPARRQSEAAVAHHNARHAVVARTGSEVIPEHLGIHVRMAVDESGCDDVTFRVDPARGLARILADEGDPPVGDP